MESAESIPSRRCVLLTRRFGPRSTFRRPRAKVVEILTYGIAVASNEADVSLHEYGIETNRVRFVLTGAESDLEAFVARLDEVVSEGAQGKKAFWHSGLPFETSPLDDGDAVLEAMVDVVASARAQTRSPTGRPFGG